MRAGTILDLSVPGCHLATSLSLHKGQCVRLDVYFSDQPPMRIELGVVRWAADGEAGIEFIRMSEEDASRLRAYAGHAQKRGRGVMRGLRQKEAWALEDSELSRGTLPHLRACGRWGTLLLRLVGDPVNRVASGLVVNPWKPWRVPRYQRIFPTSRALSSHICL